ncbi:MAG TPA: hypothetical protein VGF71_14020 [Caulobacteraceae bacterium]|jgi:hypothetical protein
MTDPAPKAASPRGRLAAIAQDLSPIPDWSSTRALIFVAVVVWLIVSAVMIFTNNALPGFRDTDDATRLIMVRQLLAGQGWYDQVIHRIDPPHGLLMHWSRLLDAGLAAMVAGLRLVMSQGQAEYWTRFAWPLMWILPGVVAGLVLARNLGGRAAVPTAALLMVIDMALYRQFYPGRIDHHDVQIVMAAIAAACATARRDRIRWAFVGGAATAFGLAVGLEALPLQAVIGASYGLALMRNRDEAGPAGAYGATLAIGAAALFLIQTPPPRWSLPVCDVMGANLAVGLAVAGLGLAVSAWIARTSPWWVRCLAVAISGAAALAAFVAADPACLHGPFVGMDPYVKWFWLDRIQEIQPLPVMIKMSQAAAIAALAIGVLAAAAAVYLVARQRRRPATSALLALAGVLLSGLVAWFAWRMQDYVYWLGVPVLAAAYSFLARRYLAELMLPTVLAALAISPVAIGMAADAATNIWYAASLKLAAHPHFRTHYTNAGPRCFAAGAYKPLAALPPGEVIAPQDLGPFILVYTHDTALAAPYHRVWPAILEAHETFALPQAQAEKLARGFHAAYIVDCPPYPLGAPKGSLGDDLRHDKVPTWLRQVSAPTGALKIYRVESSAGAK